ncbi:hypothetical protein [Streptomyces hydrogenans]|uniref:hypothetical protein n=1 Tax=Streptomyces hydrogenans TaxID=1873719 RepID=UPI0035DA57E4
METIDLALLTPEQIARATDYIELVWKNQGTREERARLEEFHADGDELAKLIGDFGGMLLADYISAVPDEHADCESGYVVEQLVAVTSRYLKRWCLTGGAEAHTAWIAAEFLIECMQEVDNVGQFLADIRGNVSLGWPAGI